MVIEHNCKKDLFGDCDTIQSIRDIGFIYFYFKKKIKKKKELLFHINQCGVKLLEL